MVKTYKLTLFFKVTPFIGKIKDKLSRNYIKFDT